MTNRFDVYRVYKGVGISSNGAEFVVANTEEGWYYILDSMDEGCGPFQSKQEASAEAKKTWTEFEREDTS